MVLNRLNTHPMTDPSRLMALRDSIYAADLFIAAVAHLNFFSWLNEHPGDLKAVCAGLRIKERPADVMVTLFKAYGLLEQKANELHLTEIAREHLVDSSPWHLGPYLATQMNRTSCLDMVKVLRTGEPEGWGGNSNEQEWAQAMEREEFSADFTEAMDSRGAFLAPALAERVDFGGCRRLLDIGGASGIYSVAIVLKNRNISATILEKPPVDRLARRSIEKRGLCGRISVVGSDMFKDRLPKGYDVHLYSNVLHDWDEDDIRILLKKSYDALDKGGMIVVHDAHLNPEKDGPLEVAEYSALLMLSTRGRCYSSREIGLLMEETGFTGYRFIPTVAHRSIITAVKPAK